MNAALRSTGGNTNSDSSSYSSTSSSDDEDVMERRERQPLPPVRFARFARGTFHTALQLVEYIKTEEQRARIMELIKQQKSSFFSPLSPEELDVSTPMPPLLNLELSLNRRNMLMDYFQ